MPCYPGFMDVALSTFLDDLTSQQTSLPYSLSDFCPVVFPKVLGAWSYVVDISVRARGAVFLRDEPNYSLPYTKMSAQRLYTYKLHNGLSRLYLYVYG